MYYFYFLLQEVNDLFDRTVAELLRDIYFSTILPRTVIRHIERVILKLCSIVEAKKNRIKYNTASHQ